MNNEKGLTYKGRIKYNKDDVLQCRCGKIIAFIREGRIYIKCRGCGKENEINVRAESR